MNNDHASKAQLESVRNLEKAELHCHLDGIINAEYLLRSDVPEAEIAEYNSFFPITDLDKWFQLGNYKSRLIQKYNNLLFDSLNFYIMDLINQNVKYAEIMLTNILFKYEDFDQTVELFQKFHSLKERSKDLELNFIMVIGRTKNEEKMNKKIARIIKLFKLKLISGVAVAGAEDACTIKRYHALFKKLKDNNVNIEIHAGEWGSSESVWDAITYGYCQRIGHGLSAFGDQKLLDTILKKNIHLEFCPTSNKILTAYKAVKNHPLIKAERLGLSYSINTDDPGDFQTDLTHEYDLVYRTFKFEAKTFSKIYNNSLRAAFRH